MKKVLELLIFLFILYFLFQIVFRYFDDGHIYEYEIKNEQEFKIKEIFTQNNKEEIDNYYIEIEVEGDVFNFQIYNVFSRTTGIIKDVKYFSNMNYKCVIPYLKNNADFTDMLCKKNNEYYYYNSIKGSDPELDSFANDNLDFSKYEDKKDIIKQNKNIHIYNNLLENSTLTLDYYKGIYVVNKKAKYRKIEIFKKERYSRDISIVMDKYYVVANYDDDYEFYEFRVVDLENYKISKIFSNYAISFDSYIQGIVDNEIYLIDKTNKKQYKINIKTKEVILIGNEQGIKVYKNNEFVDGNIYDAINNKIIFNNNTDNEFNNNEYNFLGKYGNKLSGYKLVYKNNGNKYNVYKVNIQNENIITYLFETDDINLIDWNSDYIYYKNGTEIKYFNEVFGSKTLLKYNELEFNNNIKTYIYDE